MRAQETTILDAAPAPARGGDRTPAPRPRLLPGATVARHRRDARRGPARARGGRPRRRAPGERAAGRARRRCRSPCGSTRATPARPWRSASWACRLRSRACPQMAEYAQRGDLASLLRSLGPGILRFGGASADSRVAWTDGATPRPAWASSVLTPADLRGLRTLAQESGWRVMLTVGLAHYEPRAAAREAAAAKAALGPLAGGTRGGQRARRLRTAPFPAAAVDLPAVRERAGRPTAGAIAAAAPGIPLAGPDVSGSRIFSAVGEQRGRRRAPALLTGPPLPARLPRVPRADDPSPAQLRRRAGWRTNRWPASWRSRARAGSALRLDETGSVSCGGTAGISNTFASALWAVDYIARSMAAGAAGINLRGQPGELPRLFAAVRGGRRRSWKRARWECSRCGTRCC